MTMTEPEAQRRMEHHAITTTQEAVYYYQGFRYGNLTDALSYAERVSSRANELAARKRSEDERIHPE